MRNIVIAPDSFKGTINAEKVCEIISEVILKFIPDADIKCIPMADGGEGMVSSYLKAFGGRREKACVMGANGEKIVAEYGILNDNSAVIETASCAGLPLMGDRLDPSHATTYGLGELIKSAADKGCKKLLIGLGGSATNDLGIGMAAALGYRFYDGKGRQVEPVAENIPLIEFIQRPKEELRLDITVACDVNNPLCGENGATYTFGKQKGISESLMKTIDQGMEHFAKVIENEFDVKIIDMPGAGAAGGLGAAMKAIFNAKLNSGTDMLLDKVGFDELLKISDLVFTGEGRIDWQSLSGKVPVGVARRAKKAGVPCIALCGSVGVGAELAYSEGISAIFSSVRELGIKTEDPGGYEENLRFLTDSVMRTLMIASWEKTDGREDIRVQRNKKVVQWC